MVAKDFDVGDLVWAKMKGYPDWPGKIDSPPDGTSRKGKHYIYFFGSNNCSWIADDKIKYHSEDILKSVTKKKIAFYDQAVEEIKNASKKPKSSAKASTSEEKETKSSNKASKESTPSAAKKSSPKRKDVAVKLFPKEESPLKKSIAKIPKKRPLSNIEGASGSSSKKAKDDYSTLFNSVLPSMGVNSLAVYHFDEDLKEEPPSPIKATSPKTSKQKAESRKELEIEPEFIAAPPSKTKKIGFIGLGMMGQGMVRNLLNAQHPLWIWNRTPGKCAPFVEMGAKSAATPAEVVRQSDITFCCVSDPHAVKTIMFGDNGVLEGFVNCPFKSKGYVEMTSIDSETSVEIAEAVENRGMKYLEAPIIGSKKRADDGTILILGSGDRDLFQDCESCFHAMSNHAYYMSCTVGKSASVNVITNMFLGCTYAALAEALALADRIKLSRTDLLEILELRGITSPLIMDKGKAMIENKYEADTYLKHQQKDLSLALLLSDHCDQPLSVTRAANDVFNHAKLLGCSNRDVAAVYHGVWI